eukprot:1251557-Pleurochrysis_carterae.AAC.1
MFVMYSGRQRLRKDVGHVVVRSDLAHFDAPVRDVEYSRTFKSRQSTCRERWQERRSLDSSTAP